MRQGTISVLFGCHSPIHSIVVLVAWVKIYHCLPSILGAKVAGRLFGRKGYDLVAGHNPYNGMTKSALHDPDKYSWVIAPVWWMMINTLFEPKLQRRGSTRRESAIMFKDAMRKNMASGFKELGHEIYLEQWGHYNPQ